MDTIIAAIIAAVGNLAEPAVKDAYSSLKSLITRKVGKAHPLADAVRDLEAKPKSLGRQTTLREEVEESGVGTDAEVVAAAKALLDRAQGTMKGQTSVQQEVSGDRHVFTGIGNINVRGKE